MKETVGRSGEAAAGRGQADKDRGAGGGGGGEQAPSSLPAACYYSIPTPQEMNNHLALTGTRWTSLSLLWNQPNNVLQQFSINLEPFFFYFFVPRST